MAELAGTVLLGELGLDGRVRPVRGILTAGQAAISRSVPAGKPYRGQRTLRPHLGGGCWALTSSAGSARTVVEWARLVSMVLVV
ncbi:MAG: MG(2+) CHELATASE FAMILY PROTEIN / ComM-related protein [uncultured Friedmanniella sp.]|uniref:MG(2+) CHELATASE FAMILY PROTEIN / ComM-related protein n=1 Tax=uncultured Friedmanniella sp. TaxID=335381 RepID=A0A6J4KVU7_9ACTN|nr:MAG: MG(2+) CHELATASE FAMILY PROTEIN / ComM-related protein [uncultured Friedmanniella sp.]